MKCCGNCEWCITEEEELAQIKEKNYDEEDLNRPLTGDCSLGIDHGENYCCSQHNYMEKLTNIYVLYDENYFGPGYFIVTEYKRTAERGKKSYDHQKWRSFSGGWKLSENGSLCGKRQDRV